MSDAPAAPVPESGVPPVAQDSETPVVTPGFKVFAGNLAHSTTDEGLRAFFAPVQGDIISAQVIRRDFRHHGRPPSYGFVAFTTIEAAQEAVETLNNEELDGRSVIVEIARPMEEKDRENRPRRFRKYHHSGRRGPKSVPGEVTDAEANDGTTDKAEAAPAVEGAEKPKKKKKKHPRRNKAKSGDGEAPAPAADAPTTDTPAEDAPKPKRKPRARPPRPIGEDPVGEPSTSVLFVANLGFNIDDAGLAALFTDAGLNVNSARVIRRRWKPRKSKGYGFVDVGDEAEQKKAIDALQGKDVGGRPIAVKVAVNDPREDYGAEKDSPDNEPSDAA